MYASSVNHLLTLPAERQAGVTCRGIAKSFGHGEATVHALRNVSIDILAGELTLLVGPSGCGKTTLISIIAGLLDATAGDVELFGRSIGSMSQRELVAFRRNQVGFVFQQFCLLPPLTAVENVATPLLIQGWSRRQAFAAAEGVLEQVGLADKRRALPSQLSGGQQQRVAIARSLVHSPRLLVCDEPTSALDAQTGRTVMELIKEVAVQPDRSVVVVTHDARVLDYGDRIIELADGRVAAVTDRGGEHAPFDSQSLAKASPR